MPIYIFSCSGCEYVFEELFLSIKDFDNSDENLICPKCNLKAKHKRLISSPMLKFVGKDWTPNHSRDSTSSLKDQSQLIKEDVKNIKPSEMYNVSKTKDIG